MVAIWIDPSEPARYAGITYAIMAGYLTYGLILAFVAWRFGPPQGLSGIIIHACDMTVFVIVIFLTHGPTSPFFVFFVFSVACATLRWQSRGTLWTTAAALTAVLSMALFPTDLFRDPDFPLNRFIIRLSYLAVLGALLAYLGTHEQKLRGDLSKLAMWPQTIPEEIPALAREMLEHAAGILGTPRALLCWEETEEPWLHLASWSHGALQYSRESPALFGTLVAEPLVGASFLCPDARSPLPTVVIGHPGSLRKWQGAPLRTDLQQRFDIGAVLSLRLSGTNTEGYLFGLDKPGMTSDDLVLGEIVAREVAIRLDHFYLLKQLQQGAATEERVRLARDLHDGLLQSLTGAALQMETLHRLMETDPQAARERLLEIQRLIAAEQRDLRSHIQALKPSASILVDPESTLAGRLNELAGRIERQWGLHAEVGLKHPELQLQGPLAQEIYFIVHESMINAARHARASSVHAELSVECDRMRIVVADDGRGFPFRGLHDHAALTEMNLGPVTLRERVASMGGSLSIDSGETGSRIEITLPLKEKGA